MYLKPTFPLRNYCLLYLMSILLLEYTCSAALLFLQFLVVMNEKSRVPF